MEGGAGAEQGTHAQYPKYGGDKKEVGKKKN